MSQRVDTAIAMAWIKGLSPSSDGAIPTALRGQLFGGPQRTYAVFDTGAVSEGLALVENEPGYHGSLLEGDEAKALADVMPCLLELTPDAKLVRKLFREVPGRPPALGTLHLWPANPAIFIRCNSSPGKLRQHLRRLLKPQDFKGRRRYVRLWNPTVAFDYLHDIEAPTPFLRLYLNASSDPLTIIARKGEEAVIAHPNMASFPGDRPTLSEVDIKALMFRLRSEFHERLIDRVVARGNACGYQFERARVSHISKKIMVKMEDHKPNDVPRMKDHEKLTLVLLMMHDDAADIVLNGPVMRNSRLPWTKRVDIVAKSYLTGLRRMYGLEVI